MSEHAQAGVDDASLSFPRWQMFAFQSLVGLGLILRTFHYLYNHVIWYDEAVLLLNVLQKDWLELLGPLDYEVAAPPLYLWSLRAIALTIGDVPSVWRLPSFLLSSGTLVLIAMLVRQVADPVASTIVVGIVAFSDAFVWLGCCIKPYALDAFLAAALCLTYMRTDTWTTSRRLLLFGVPAPFLLSLSYPMLFVYAGLLAAFLPAVWHERRLPAWAAYGLLMIGTLATFAALSLGPVQAQRCPGLLAGWNNKFPPIECPAEVPGWVIGNGVLVFHYLFNPVGAFLVPLSVLAGLWCLRRGRWQWLSIFLGPLGATLLASFVKAYPFSGNRLMLFAAPGLAVMSGIGLSLLIDWTRRYPVRPALGLALVLIVPELGLCGWRIYRPWHQPDVCAASEFVRAHRQPEDLMYSEGTLLYFLRDQADPLESVNASTARPGQRLWAAFDAYTVQPSLACQYTLSRLQGSQWRVDSETNFSGAKVLLFVRRDRPPITGKGSTHQSGKLPNQLRDPNVEANTEECSGLAPH